MVEDGVEVSAETVVDAGVAVAVDVGVGCGVGRSVGESVSVGLGVDEGVGEDEQPETSSGTKEPATAMPWRAEDSGTRSSVRELGFVIVTGSMSASATNSGSGMGKWMLLMFGCSSSF